MSEREYSIEPSDPEAYLSQHLDKSSPSKAEIMNSLALNSTLFHDTEIVEQPGRTTEIRAHEGNYDVTYKYAPLDSHKLSSEVVSYMRSHYGSDEFEEDFFKLKEMAISKEGEILFDIKNNVPSDYTILCSNKGTFWLDVNEKILCAAPVDSITNLMNLAHEGAHAQIDSLLDDAERKKQSEAIELFNSQKEIDSDVASIVLKCERDAWALALKNLKPFFDKGDEKGLISKEDALSYIHRIILVAYGRGIADKLSRQLSRDKS